MTGHRIQLQVHGPMWRSISNLAGRRKHGRPTSKAIILGLPHLSWITAATLIRSADPQHVSSSGCGPGIQVRADNSSTPIRVDAEFLICMVGAPWPYRSPDMSG